LPFAPEWSATVGYQHTFKVTERARLAVALDSRLESSKWLANEYLAGEYQGSYSRSNANVTLYIDSQWSVSGYVRNIEDEAVKSTTFVQPVLGVPVVTLLPPRTYGLQVTAKF
jgi:iron complex outermembrane receptor protein